MNPKYNLVIKKVSGAPNPIDNDCFKIAKQGYVSQNPISFSKRFVSKCFRL